MASSPASSDLSDPPSAESDAEEQLSTAVPSPRPSFDMSHPDSDLLDRPFKRRKMALNSSSLHGANLEDRASSAQPALDDGDTLSISSDGFSSAPGSPSHAEHALREDAQTVCLWKDCSFGEAANNDDLVRHVQTTHCATGGPKRTKYVCEWGECQRKTSNHPSGYALKAHMRSHTKEKPYYCFLPECDKSFTRSDALAKHMRTVHDPEPVRASGAVQNGNEPTPPGKKPLKIKLANGSAASKDSKSAPLPVDAISFAPTHDEDGNPVEPSPPNDNITYIPAHHPVTGQPGFMINYPPDIHFNTLEAGVSAPQLMRLLRRQLHWAQQEGEELKKDIDELEQLKRQEWTLKEMLLDGMLEAELSRAEQDDLLHNVYDRARRTMERDVEPARNLQWTHGTPSWRGSRRNRIKHVSNHHDGDDSGDIRMEEYDDDDNNEADSPSRQLTSAARTPSPPPTAQSGGFDGDADPYDNYLANQMASYEERERLRSLQNTPQQVRIEQKAAEADAIGALLDLGGGGNA